MHFLREIQRYVRFDQRQTELLRDFLPLARPAFASIVARFYERVLEHPDANNVFSSADQVARQKQTLLAWMESGLAGPHDHVYFEKRARIGRVHVEIGLPQHYMLTAMNVLRLEFRQVAYAAYVSDLERLHQVSDALDRLFDLELAIMLDTYAEDSQDRVRRHERLAVIGQLAASIGHDLRNPLGVIESSVYILRKRVAGDERAQSHLQKITNQVATCNHIVTDLLEMARKSPVRLEDIELHALATEVLEALALPGHMNTVVSVPMDTLVRGERGLLRQCLVNLLTNAAAALEDQTGDVEIFAVVATDSPDIMLEVRDTGPGFAPHILRRAFEPLVTTRAKGTGLGLALVKSIVERHGGRVAAENRQPHGAVVRLILPLNPEEEPLHGEDENYQV